MTKIKCGSGIDFHRFKEAKDSFVMLGGIKIPSDYEIIAHSDGDVVLHALTDAILGTIGAGDIGAHFPPTDMKWKDADSTQFIKHAHSLLLAKGGKINNVDVTIICEVPKIGSHRERIRAQIASILNLSIDDVSIKATTTEGMGFLGRKEGIAAQGLICAEFKNYISELS